MKASELIAELAAAISNVGDHEVVIEIQDHYGHMESNVRTGPVSFVTDRTYKDRPFRIVSRKRIKQVGSDLPERERP